MFLVRHAGAPSRRFWNCQDKQNSASRTVLDLQGTSVRLGYAILEKEPHTGLPKLTDELCNLFLPNGLRELLEKSSDQKQVSDFETKYLLEVAKQLKMISEDQSNWMIDGVPVGTTKVKIGDKNVPIKEILLVSAANTLPIFIAVSALVTGPATLVLAAKAAAANGPASAKLFTAIQTYTPVETRCTHGSGSRHESKSFQDAERRRGNSATFFPTRMRTHVHSGRHG
jgi:hypothetical protein